MKHYPRRGVISEHLYKMSPNAKPPRTAKKHGEGVKGTATLTSMKGSHGVDFKGKPAGYSPKSLLAPMSRKPSAA
jgi:hypothetical protein